MVNRSESLGVSAGKEDVHHAIRNLDKGLFPNAFCKVLPDYVAKDPDFVNFIHADTAGTKTSLAYLYWLENPDPAIWHHIAQDAMVMNLDDLACVGCIQDIIISSTIGRNKHLISGAIIEHLIEGTQAFINSMKAFDIQIHSGGGETADVGDIVRTIDVGITAFGRINKTQLIVNNIQAGNVIISLASSGQSIYENQYNSGIGSNGLTAARHDILKKNYAAIEASFSPETNKEFVYTGSYSLSDLFTYQSNSYSIGSLLLSPTRSYIPILNVILNNFRSKIDGIIHCTGGAQTKVKKFISGVRVVKNNLFPLPPVFELLKQHTLCSPAEMYEVYNMGHRLEIYTSPEVAEEIIAISKSFEVDAQIIGHVEASPETEIIINSSLGEFKY